MMWTHLSLTDLIMWRLDISMARRRSGKRQCGIRERRSNILFLNQSQKAAVIVDVEEKAK